MRASLERAPDESYSALSSSNDRLRAIALLQQRAASLESEIAERKQTEQLLAEQNALLERMATGCSLDECLAEVTQAVARLSPQTRVGLLLADETRATVAAVYAAEMPSSFGDMLTATPIMDRATDPCGTALQSGQPTACSDIAQDERCSPQWREWCAANGIRACHAEPVTGVDGEPLATLMLCFDTPRSPSEWELRVTRFGAHIASIAIERDREAQALRASQERLAAVFHSTAVGVAVVTTTTRFLQVNEAFCHIVGYASEELTTGMDCAALILPDDLAALQDQIEAMLAGRIPTFDIELRLRRKDGALIWVHQSVSLARVATEQSMHLVALCHDITDRKRAEAAAAHLAAIVTSAEDAIASKTLEGIVTSWNASAERMFGYTAEEMIGQPITRLFPPDRLKEEDLILARIRSGQRIEHFETVRVTKGGRALEVALTISPIRDSAGAITGASKIVRDITARKEAERRLAESEARFGAVFNQAACGLVQADATGRMTLVNQRWCEMLGYTEAELLQKNIADVTHSASLAPTLEGVGRLATGGPDFVIEKNYLRKDGSLLPASSSVSALRGPDGAYQGLVAVVLDISARKRAEAAVRESEERFRTLADNIPTLAWMAHPDGNIFWYNQRWYDYTGTTSDSQEGWGWESVHDPEMLPEVMERWTHSLATGELFEMVFPLRGADGVYRPFLTRVQPIHDDEGRVVRWFGTNTDVSDLREAEEALRTANRRLDEFLHTATHELKTPLTAMLANLQLSERRIQRLLAASSEGTSTAPSDALQTVAQLLARNEQQTRRLTRLVDDLVDAARIQADKLEIFPVPCDLAEIVSEVVTDQRAVRPERAIDLQFVIPEGQPALVEADADRIGQVLTNYLTNALKYSPAASPVTVVLEVHSDCTPFARVWVRDEGPGIPLEEQTRIWERGHRVASIVPTSAGVGLGLGLHISREIVLRHSGQVGVESAPHEGSAFWFTLPLVRDERPCAGA